MSDRSKNLLVLLAVLACLIAAGVAAVTTPATLGLDLQGGTEVVLQAVPDDPAHPPTQAQIDQSISIISNRVNGLGVSEPTIQREGSDRVSVALAGVKDPNRALAIISTTAKLQMFPYESSLVPGVSADTSGNPAPRSSLYAVLHAAQALPPAGSKPLPQYYVFDTKTKKTLAGPEASKALVLQDLKRPLQTGETVLAVPRGYLVAYQQSTPTAPKSWYLFKLPTDPNQMIVGDELSSARQDFDSSGAPMVSLTFTDKGGQKFQAITKQLAIEGANAAALAGQTSSDPTVVQQYAKHFATVLDGRIVTVPYIDYKQLPSGIDPSTGGASINNISLSEAKDVALLLSSGSLPVSFKQLYHTTVSATLGKDSLRQGLIAGIAGLIAVMIYLLFFYRFLGLIADIALLIYAALFYGLVVMIPITMTLPGIAGMILTIGVAADANVVIFERIKEEVRLGKTVRAAIGSGYTKGFKTIVDANVVTLITAAVLFVGGTGSVKGFAFTLAVGVIVSLFTAVLATRAMLTALAGFRWFNNASFMGASGQKVRWRLDVVGRRWVWFSVSGAVLLIGAISLIGQGLNLGIDFKGGTRITTNTAKAATVDQVRTTISRVDSSLQSNAQVQGTGQSVAGRYRAFQIQTPTVKNGQATRIEAALARDYGPLSKQADTTVSASFGSEILKSALVAIFVSLLLIVAYLSFRFEFKFALPAIVALFHDLLITVGIYSVTQFQVTAATVAAVLTVLGYSLYDTIIVFDRVRENTPLLRKNSFAQVVDVSIWETLTRSLNTSLITLVPILSLLLFGGSTLKDFAFALFIGIASGAYSSIFIAAPLLAMWKEQEPEYRRLRGGSVPVRKATLADAGLEAPAVEPKVPVPVPAGDAPAEAAEVPDDERAAREAARKRRLERRSRPHGRAR